MNDLEASPDSTTHHHIEDPLQYSIILAEALRRMHSSGGVCASLNPDHMVWENGQLHLHCDQAEDLSPYRSPEQVRGEPADPRSDIFSFGALVYEAFSGHKA